MLPCVAACVAVFIFLSQKVIGGVEKHEGPAFKAARHQGHTKAVTLRGDETSPPAPQGLHHLPLLPVTPRTPPRAPRGADAQSAARTHPRQTRPPSTSLLPLWEYVLISVIRGAKFTRTTK